MAGDRSVKVVLRANVSEFKAQMASASTSLDQLVRKGDESARVAETGMGRMAQSARLQSAEWSMVGNALLGVGVAGAAVFGGLIATTVNFEQQMSAVQAATLSSASEMETLREAAKQAGADTAFSATEAAQGIEELAKAGVSTADILSGGLKGSLDLAAAGSISVQEASEAAASAMVQFKLGGEDVTHVADLLAAGAGKAQGGVSELNMALSQAGVVASSTGLTIEETVGTLSAFASAGLMGSDAGTSFKSMLQRLQNPTNESKQLLDQLGISLYDTSGNVVTMANLAGQLQSALSGMTAAQRDAAMAQIFGSDAVRAANILYQQGEEGINNWTAAVNDAGYASEVAATRQDNLAGSWEKFTGSLETAAISIGENLTPILITIVDGATSIVDAFTNLPGPIQGVIAGLGGLVTVGALAGGAFLKLYPSLQQMGEAFTALKAANIPVISKGLSMMSTGAKSLISPAGLAVGAVIGLTTAIIAQGQARVAATKQRISELADAYNDLSSAGEAAQRQTVLKWLEDDGMAQKWVDAGADINDVIDAIMGVPGALEKANAAIGVSGKTMVSATGEVSNSIEDMVNENSGLIGTLDGYIDMNGKAITEAERRAEVERGAADASGEAADASGGLATSVNATSDATKEATDTLNQYIDALSEAAGNQLSLSDAQIGYQDAVASASAAIAANGATLDLTTEAGRKNQAALDDVASSAWKLVEAQANTGAGSEELQGTMVNARDEFLRTAQSMGMTAEDANNLANKYGLIPANVTTAVKASGIDEALAGMDRVLLKLAAVNGRSASVTIRENVMQIGSSKSGMTGLANADGNILTFANGTENHVAEIAAAGSWRVWAEDETGGEAYIPLASSKRQRSTDILSQVADRFGYSLTKYGNGGVSAYSAVPRSHTQYVVVPATNESGGIATLSDSQVERLAEAFETGANRVSSEWVGGSL